LYMVKNYFNKITDYMKIEKKAMDEASIAGVLAAILGSAVFIIILQLKFNHGISIHDVFMPEHIKSIFIYDARNQVFAYKLVLITVMLFTIFSCFYFKVKEKPVFLSNLTGYVYSYAGLILFLLTLIYIIENKRIGYLGSCIGSYLLIYFAVKFSGLFKNTFMLKIILLIAAVYSIFVISCGFFSVPVLEGKSLFLASNWHYGIVVSPADRLAAGMQIGEMVQAKYGLLMPIILGAMEKSFGLFDFGGHIRFIQVTQVLFFILAIISFYLYKPGRWVFIIFMSLLLAPWLNTMWKGVLIPNQSGWRSIGFPAGIIILMLVKNMNLNLRSFLFGAGSVFVILLNPETGISITAAYVIFSLLVTREINVKNILSGSVLFAAGASLIIVFFFLIFFYIYGNIEPGVIIGLLTDFILKFSGGYAGLKIKFEPFAAVLLVHSIYLAAKGTFLRSKGPLEAEDSIKISIAIAILVWLTYYVNRPDSWNLWTYIYLYGFLIAGSFKVNNEKNKSFIFNSRNVLFACVLMPLILSSNRETIKTIIGNIGENQNLSEISGVLISKKTADLINIKSEFAVKTLSIDNNPVFLTKYSYILPLQIKYFNRLPFNDIFNEAYTVNDYDRNLKTLIDSNKKYIYFDALEKDMIREELLVEDFYKRVKDGISGAYEPAEISSGWEIWKRKDSIKTIR